jgi:hypothetical protein
MTAYAETQPLGIAALPFVNWIFWGALAGGTLLAVGLTQWRGGTTLGYRRFMAATIVIFALVWLLSELNAPGSAVIESSLSLRRGLVLVFTLLAFGYLVTVLTPVPAWVGTGVAVAGGAVSLLALLIIPGAGADGDTILVSAGLVTATLALGSVTAGMLLGHWYLVTPKLSPDPLRRLIWLLIGALVTQGLLVAWSVVTAWAVIEPTAWLTGLRFFVGVVFPLAVAILALRATDAPSMQSTTGLLYVGLAAVMAGTIGAVSLVYLGWGAV